VGLFIGRDHAEDIVGEGVAEGDGPEFDGDDAFFLLGFLAARDKR
jgi:hypothetical protein